MFDAPKTLTEEQIELLDSLASMRNMRMKPATVVTAMPASQRGKLVELIWAMNDLLDAATDSNQRATLPAESQRKAPKTPKQDATE